MVSKFLRQTATQLFLIAGSTAPNQPALKVRAADGDSRDQKPEDASMQKPEDDTMQDGELVVTPTSQNLKAEE